MARRHAKNGETYVLTIKSEITDMSGDFPSFYEEYATGKLPDGTEFRIAVALGSRSLYLFIKDRIFTTGFEPIARAFVSKGIDILAAEKKSK